METRSLNCSVFFNPNSTGILSETSPPVCVKSQQKKRVKVTTGCSPCGELFSIKYVPKVFQTVNSENAAIPSKNEKNESKKKCAKQPCKSCVEIEEFISPTNKSKAARLKMNYVLDEGLKCKTCLELKHALDFTIQKLHSMAQMKGQTVRREDIIKKGERKLCMREIRRRCKLRGLQCKNSQSLDRDDAVVTKTYINELEDVGPLSEFFSRLIRTATINKIKDFSKNLEEKLIKRETALLHSKNIDKHKRRVENTKEMHDGQQCKIEAPNDNICESCIRLQQSMYETVNGLYEAAGIRTDFPTVQKLETYAFLVYPDGVKFPICKKQIESRNKHSSSHSHAKAEPGKDPECKFETQKRKKRYEDFLEEENKKLFQARVKRHRAVFTASKFVHILTALIVSLTTIFIIWMDWIVAEQAYSAKVFGVLAILFIGCVYNIYLIFVLRVFSFKQYCIIPICWVILTLTNGKCADPLVPDYVCDSKIHFMSHVYLFAVLFEYYLASGIHAVLVLEINQFHRLPRNDLLKYAFFNLPLMIIVLFYIAFQEIGNLFNRVKKYVMGDKAR